MKGVAIVRSTNSERTHNRCLKSDQINDDRSGKRTKPTNIFQMIVPPTNILSSKNSFLFSKIEEEEISMTKRFHCFSAIEPKLCEYGVNKWIYPLSLFNVFFFFHFFLCAI